MVFRGFRCYKTVKIKIPRPCCDRCDLEQEVLKETIDDLKRRITEVETNVISTTSVDVLTFV